MSARDLHLILVGASIALSLAVALQARRVPHWSHETRLVVSALVTSGAIATANEGSCIEGLPRFASGG